MFEALIGFVLGAVIVWWLTERRWRENASRVQRIESGGQLFKVLHGSVYDDLVARGVPIVPGTNFMGKI